MELGEEQIVLRVGQMSCKARMYYYRLRSKRYIKEIGKFSLPCFFAVEEAQMPLHQYNRHQIFRWEGNIPVETEYLRRTRSLFYKLKPLDPIPEVQEIVIHDFALIPEEHLPEIGDTSTKVDIPKDVKPMDGVMDAVKIGSEEEDVGGKLEDGKLPVEDVKPEIWQPVTRSAVSLCVSRRRPAPRLARRAKPREMVMFRRRDVAVRRWEHLHCCASW